MVNTVVRSGRRGNPTGGCGGGGYSKQDKRNRGERAHTDVKRLNIISIILLYNTRNIFQLNGRRRRRRRTNHVNDEPCVRAFVKYGNI